MKPLLFFSVLLIKITSISAQPINFQWARTIGGNHDEVPRIMKVDNHGNVYLFFETESARFSIDQNFFYTWIYPENRPINNILLKFDSKGKLLWGKSLLTDIGMEALGMTIDQDDNIILSLHNQGSLLHLDTMIIYSNPGIFMQAAVLIKLDQSGLLLDYTYFTSTNDIYNIGGIVHDKKNNYYITIKSRTDILNMNGDTILNSNLNRGSYLSVFKLTNDLNLIWVMKMYNVSGYFRDIKVDKEENIIVYGMFRGKELQVDSLIIKNADTKYLSNDAGDDEIFLLKLNPEGKALWLKSIQGKDIDYCAYNDITFDSDNNIYIGGMFGSDTLIFNPNISLFKGKRHNNYFDLFYAKYSAKGECIWARTIERSLIDLVDNMTIHVLNDDYIVLSSNFTDSVFNIGNSTFVNKGRSDCFVLIAKTNGEIITGISYGGDKIDFEQQLASSGNDLYIFSMFGSRELKFNDVLFKNDTTDGSLDAILIKYSLDSLVSTNDVASKEISINIFPNPATTSIYLQLSEKFEIGLYYYNIYSIKGDFIASGIMQSTNAEVNLNSLPPGEYVLSGGNLKGNKFSGKFTVIR